MAKTAWVATHDHNNLEPPNGVPLRFRERFDASRPSSSPGVRRGVGSGDACAARPTMGEYERKPGVGAGENEETCRSMTNSCVAFVSFTIFVRRVNDSGCAGAAWLPLPLLWPAAIDAAVVVPRVLSAFDS